MLHGLPESVKPGNYNVSHTWYLPFLPVIYNINSYHQTRISRRAKMILLKYLDLIFMDWCICETQMSNYKISLKSEILWFFRICEKKSLHRGNMLSVQWSDYILCSFTNWAQRGSDSLLSLFYFCHWLGEFLLSRICKLIGCCQKFPEHVKVCWDAF